METKKQYNSNTQTLITTGKKEYIDAQTGEIVHIDTVTKRIYGAKQFWKIYLMDFLGVLGIIDSKQLDVFIYIAENTNPSTNQFIGTYDKIAEITGVSRPTIATIMKKLRENNFITKVQNGVYAINPNIMMKGNDHKRQILLNYYEESSIENQALDVKRGKSLIEIEAPFEDKMQIEVISDED